jgi:hypothetical protein
VTEDVVFVGNYDFSSYFGDGDIANGPAKNTQIISITHSPAFTERVILDVE